MGVFPGQGAEVRAGELPVGLVHHEKPPHLPGPFRQGPKGLPRKERSRGGVGVREEEHPPVKAERRASKSRENPSPKGTAR